jgi:hypothetical protein
MENVITALKDTPIPTLLVIAGIVFLLLSIAGQLAGRITVPPERQRQATIIGCLLVVVGVALHVMPSRLIPPEPQGVPAPTPHKPVPKEDQPPQTSTTPPSTQPSPTPPEPTVQAPQGEAIPSLNARLTALRFFETGPADQKIYKQRFPQAFTQAIMAEIALQHPKPGRRIDFVIQALLFSEGGRKINTLRINSYIAADSESSIHTFDVAEGMFYVGPGHWSVGSYRLDVYINDQKVTSGIFEVFPQ